MNIKIKGLLILALISVCTFAQAQLTDYSIFDQKFNFYIANDLGRNGYYDQKPIAELMGTMGEEVGPEFVLATGDIHHFEGVRSVNDPLWMTNYELIYSHPELMIDWFPIFGNTNIAVTHKLYWTTPILAAVGQCPTVTTQRDSKKKVQPSVSFGLTRLL